MHITQKRGRLHDHLNGAAAVLCLWVVVNLLVASCDACSWSRRSHPAPRPTTVGTTAGLESTKSISSSTSPSTIISSTESPSDISPSENLICFSTTIMNLTNETIATKLEQLAHNGNLSNLFVDNTTERRVFLKLLKPNDTGCSNASGYMIKISKITNGSTSRFEYNITRLNETSAANSCRRFENCPLLIFSAKSKPTTATSKMSEEPSPKDATSKQTTGSRPTGDTISKKTNTGAAGKAGDAAVSTTTIVIPVTLVALLVIVGIFVLWFKRRSARKNNKELTKMQNSVDRLAGPVNGDVYTAVNPSGKNDSNELVYTELAEIKPGKRDVKQPESNQTEYADITHIRTDDITGCKKGTPQTDENEAYANVVALKNDC